MKIAKGLLLLLAIWIGLAAAFSGCTCVVNNYHYGTARPSAMYVANAPPAPKEEVRTTAPAGDFVWIAGYWEWSASEETWIWVGGSWVEPPDEEATWVGPEYEDNNGDWMYSPGYWRWEGPGESAPDDAETSEPPAGDLHWAGGQEVESPGGVAKPDIPTVEPYQLATPKEDEPVTVVGPTKTLPPKSDAVEAKEEPPQVTAPGLEVDDPYGSDVGEVDDGDGDDSKRLKKPKVKDVKPKKPDMPDVVEHAASTPAPEAKTAKKHKAKAEPKVDEESVKAGKSEQVEKTDHKGKTGLQIKEPDKIKKHR